MGFIGVQPATIPLTASDITNDIINADKIADNSISEEHLDPTIITGLSALGSEPADTDEFLISDAGTLKRMDYSYIKGGGIHPQVGFAPISASQNINIDGVFSSTYKNYSIFIEGWSHQNSTSQLYWTYRTGTSGSYASGGTTQGGVAAGRLRVAGSDPTFMGNDAQNDQSVRLTTDVYNNEYSSLHLYCFNPYSTSRRSTISGRAVYREGSTGLVGFTDFGFISIGSEQHTGFNLYTQGSFNSGGTVTVYGITDGS